jgi:hypothetical protein
MAMTMNTQTEDDLKIVREVGEKVFTSIHLGVDFSQLSVLDDVNASRRAIQRIGEDIGAKNPEVIGRILGVADSAYFGHYRLRDEEDFFEAVMRLGADRVKVLLLCFILFSLGGSKADRMRAAKTYSVSILARILAHDMSLAEEVVRKIETGALISQLGPSLFYKARELGMEISDDFIDRYKTELSTIFVDRFELDPFYKRFTDLSIVEFDEDSLAMVGIIKLAELLIEDSFRKYGKLVVRSPMPDDQQVLSKTIGADIQNLFGVIGVEEYLEVREKMTQRQKDALQKKRGLHRRDAAGDAPLHSPAAKGVRRPTSG